MGQSQMDGEQISRQTARDHITLALRTRRCSEHFQRVRDLLKGRTKAQLLQVAHNISAKYHVDDADRLCHRRFDAIVCWFIENMRFIMIDYPALLGASPGRNNAPASSPDVAEDLKAPEPDFTLYAEQPDQDFQKFLQTELWLIHKE
jgi:hypothetical protein